MVDAALTESPDRTPSDAGGEAAVKRGWICALPVVVLLGSATPPLTLGYESVIGPACARSGDCAALFDEVAVRLAAERRQAEADARALAEAAAIDAGLKLLISIPQQTLYVFHTGELIATSPVSTGKPGHATPLGTFPILQKAVVHHSNLYSNAPMPYMQRLTVYGVALHAGTVRGYPASHGCIRLPLSFARKLYGMTSWTTRVTITRSRPGSADEALGLVPRAAAPSRT